jgi:hypothetical protein
LASAFADMPGIGGVAATPRASGAVAAVIADAAETLTAAGVAAAVWDTPQGAFLYAVAHNRVVTDPAAGTYTVYAADDVTVAYVADLWQDAAGTTPYSGAGADRRDRLV